MEPIDNPIEVPFSEEDGGNGTPPAAPSQTPQPPEVPGEQVPAVPAVPPEPTPTVDPQTELYELPDGRKVDAATLTREWKENFLPDYTRKSQALAAQQPQPTAPLPAQTPTDPYADPNYVPQSYAEIIELAKQAALTEIEQRQQQEIEQRQAVETAVTQQINELRTVDPNLNENALFLHATKYGFRDLKLAHQNMKDMSAAIKTVQQQTAQNVQKRNQDPIAATPGNSGGALPNPSQFENSIEYLRSLNK